MIFPQLWANNFLMIFPQLWANNYLMTPLQLWANNFLMIFPQLWAKNYFMTHLQLWPNASSICPLSSIIKTDLQVIEDDALVEGLDWYILPVLNPDGYQFTHEHVKYLIFLFITLRNVVA